MSPLSKGGAEPVANQVDRVLRGGTRWHHHAHGPGGCCVRPNEQVYKYEVRPGGVISFRVPVYQKVAQRRCNSLVACSSTEQQIGHQHAVCWLLVGVADDGGCIVWCAGHLLHLSTGCREEPNADVTCADKCRAAAASNCARGWLARHVPWLACQPCGSCS